MTTVLHLSNTVGGPALCGAQASTNRITVTQHLGTCPDCLQAASQGHAQHAAHKP